MKNDKNNCACYHLLEANVKALKILFCSGLCAYNFPNISVQSQYSNDNCRPFANAFKSLNLKDERKKGAKRTINRDTEMVRTVRVCIGTLCALKQTESIVFEIRTRLRLIIVDYLHVKMIIQGYYLKKPAYHVLVSIPIRASSANIEWFK